MLVPRDPFGFVARGHLIRLRGRRPWPQALRRTTLLRRKLLSLSCEPPRYECDVDRHESGYAKDYRVFHSVRIRCNVLDYSDDCHYSQVRNGIDHMADKAAKRTFFQMEVLADELQLLDELRRREPDLPSRAAMVRRLIERAADKGRKR